MPAFVFTAIAYFLVLFYVLNVILEGSWYSFSTAKCPIPNLADVLLRWLSLNGCPMANFAGILLIWMIVSVMGGLFSVIPVIRKRYSLFHVLALGGALPGVVLLIHYLAS